MHKRLRLTAITLAAASLSCAHAGEMPNVLRALGSAILGSQSQQQDSSKPIPVPSAATRRVPPMTDGFNHVGGKVDTPENLALLKSRVRARIEAADLEKTSNLELLQVCDEEMKPLHAFERVIDTGYDELRAKCGAEAREPINEFYDRRAAYVRKQREAAAAAEAQKEGEKKAEEERQMAQAMADLRSGKRQPVNCPQWVAAKGKDPRSLDAPVMQVAYQPPKGVGPFLGRVEKINGDTMVLSDQPIMRMHGTAQGYMVVTVAGAKIFDGSQIKVGTVVQGFANQTGSRTMRMTDGSGQQAPVLVATCMHALL